MYAGIKDPVEAYEAVEWAAREEIMNCGGCISHHHGFLIFLLFDFAFFFFFL